MKILKKLLLSITVFLAAIISANAKTMTVEELGKEIDKEVPDAQYAYIIGSYVFTSQHTLTMQDVMLASRSIKVTNNSQELNTEKIYDEMTIHYIIKNYDKVSHQATGWVPSGNKDGDTKLYAGDNVSVRFIDYEFIEEDSNFDVSINIDNQKYRDVLNGYKFDENFTQDEKLYSKNLALDKGNLTGIVRLNSKVDNKVFDEEKLTGFYVPVVLSVPKANSATTVKVDTWWGTREFTYNDFELKEADKAGMVILLSLNPDAESKVISITVDVDGTGKNYASKKYVLDWTKVDFEKSLYKNIASKAKSDKDVHFAQLPSETNGLGVMAINSTLSENFPIYYYRGQVNDNNVIFNNLCWQIVRTTDEGGIKLIYNGRPTDGKCSSTGKDTAIDGSTEGTQFSRYSFTPKYAGYVQGSSTKQINYNLAIGVADGKVKLAEDVTYDNSRHLYTLSGDIVEYDKKDFVSPNNTYGLGDGKATEIKEKLKTHRYTCFRNNKDADKTSCSDIAYILTFDTEYSNGSNKVYTGRLGYITFSMNEKYTENYPDSFSYDATKSTVGSSSEVKSKIDDWYTNVGIYSIQSKFIENAKYCNTQEIKDYGIFDTKNPPFTARTLFSSVGSFNKYYILYKNFDNLLTGGNPTLDCRKEDTLVAGKNSFYFSAAMLTADEANYAGINFSSSNSSSYLNTGINYWTMTPSTFAEPLSSGDENLQRVMYISKNGLFGTNSVSSGTDLYTRPVIALKNSVTFTQGDGTIENPFVIIQ